MMTGKMGEKDSREDIEKVFKLFADDNANKISFRNLACWGTYQDCRLSMDSTIYERLSTCMGTLTTHLHHHPFFSLFSSLPTPTPTRCGTDHLVVQRFYRLLLVAALIAASGAIPLNDEILPEDNQFISVDTSARELSQGEVPPDEEELDEWWLQALQEQTKQAAAGKKEAEEKFATTTAAFTEQTMSTRRRRNVPWNGTRRRRMDGGHAAGYSSAWKNAPPPPPMVVNTTRRRRHVTRRRRYHANHSDKIWIRAPPPPPTATIVTNGPSWTASQQVCTNQAKQLCTFDQICPNGEGSTPVDGGSSVAHDWSAMLRADGVTNDWVHISGSGHTNCKPHGKYHGLPDWGTQPSNIYNHRIYCCDQPSTGSAATFTIQQKVNMRYMDAHESSNDHSAVTRTVQGNDSQKWIVTASDEGFTCPN